MNYNSEYIQAEELIKLTPVEASKIIEVLPEVEQVRLIESLPIEFATHTFEYLNIEYQKKLIRKINNRKVAKILNLMSADDRTLLLEYLPNEAVKELIQLLSEKERKITLELLGFPEYSVGRIMTPDYIAVKEYWTVNEVLEYVRKYGKNSETLNVIYVTDDQGRLIDDLKIREILLSPQERKVSELMDRKFVYLKATQDQEEAITFFKEHNRVALPVVDDNQLLSGIVTIDDILVISREEDTEDIHKIGGSDALDEPYMSIPLFRMVRKRAGWLVILFLGEMLTATAMGFFEEEIARAVVLALFVPLIISSGGNSGSQATTLIIRAMALGEIKPDDWWRVMKREILSGLLLGIILGSIGFLRISVWSLFTNVYGEHWLLVGMTVGFSLVGIVLWGSLSGSMLPLILRRIGLDPATSSAPFVATLVDVTGLIIYFSVAYTILKGSLL